MVLICISLTWLSGKVLTGHAEGLGSIPGSGKSSGEGNSDPLPVSLPRKSRGQRTEAGYSPRGCKRVRHNLATKQQKTTTVSDVDTSHVPVGHLEVFVGRMSIWFLCFKIGLFVFFFIELCQFFICLGVLTPYQIQIYPHSLKAELSYETF